LSNELKKIVKRIQFDTDKTIEEIAKEVGYARAYFTNQINIGTNKKLKDLLLEKFPAEIEHNVLKEPKAEYKRNTKGVTYFIEIKTASGKNIQVIPEGQTEVALLNAFMEEREKTLDELKADKIKLQNTIDTNLTAMMQLLSALSRHDRAFHDTILRSLARLEGKKEVDLVAEARSFEAAKQNEEMTMSNRNDNRI
jgi:hypothetical protein